MCFLPQYKKLEIIEKRVNVFESLEFCLKEWDWNFNNYSGMVRALLQSWLTCSHFEDYIKIETNPALDIIQSIKSYSPYQYVPMIKSILESGDDLYGDNANWVCVSGLIMYEHPEYCGLNDFTKTHDDGRNRLNHVNNCHSRYEKLVSNAVINGDYIKDHNLLRKMIPGDSIVDNYLKDMIGRID